MRRASPGRAARIVISSIPVIVPGFAAAGEGLPPATPGSVASAGRCRYRAHMRNTRRRLVGALVLSAATLVAAAAPRAAEPQKHHHRHHRAAVKKPARHAAPAKTGRPAAAAKPAAAAAIGTHALGKADSWTAYVSEDSSGRVCYLAGPPQKSEPAGLARKPPMADR